MPRSKRILIIDDETGFHSLFSRVLNEESYKVISVHSGKEALERLMYNNFDLIILDLVLQPPGRSGMETLDAIRKINTEICVSLPALTLSQNTLWKPLLKEGRKFTFQNRSILRTSSRLLRTD